jgi:ribosomal protein S18 acetylase RimI-like enzyme
LNLSFREQVIESDLEAVRRIVVSSGFFYPAEVEVAVELVADRLSRGESSGYHFLFAESDGRVIGYACFGPIACTLASYDLYWIAVHSEFRGRGLGRELLLAAEERIAALGGQRVYIETSSRSQYHPTRAFYQRCDYRQEAILADFYAPGDDKVIYLKVLSSSASAGRL